ncbi:MAG: hypothetical protein BAJALOKI1v1_200003 [Promethearchaeota archaeon]|nr:MAG: hypothetical protein BAJALOKI1v1_200003 [Candidatus Lokiarchaeota archaeon]
MELKDHILNIVDKHIYEKAEDFPTKNIKIISLKEDPILISALFFDKENEREFHIIIDEEQKEIFHDCPSFLIYSDIEKKLCAHVIKLLMILQTEEAIKILKEIHSYKLTSEDFGSEKKRKNFELIASQCFEDKGSIIEGLTYLNKAIISEFDCEPTIKKYLTIALKNELLIEFFEFLKNGYKNNLNKYFKQNEVLIEKGFRTFLKTIDHYSFYNLLRIIDYLNSITSYKDLDFLSENVQEFKDMINSKNLNLKYFAIYFIKKNYEKLVQINEKFKSIITQNNLEDLKKQILSHFFEEIEDFCIIEKLKLMRSQFDVLGIPKEQYEKTYQNYKREIKSLEKAVYLKKFAFLKLLMDKYDVKKTKINFKKKRNIYIVDHNEENLQNPVYKYIIRKLGFFGEERKSSAIKSSDLGVNYFIIRELFLDDLTQLSDIFYYKKQFWGDEEYQIRVRDGFPLLRNDIDYSYEIEQDYSNENVMIIEWDLAKNPIKGSLINASSSQIMIPNQNNPLFHDLKPFDLCYCIKRPVKIEANTIKIINVITKCSFKDAIRSVSQGMEFIEGYGYPLSLVKAVIKKYINPFEAHKIVMHNPNKEFIPDYKKFMKEFQKFLFEYINEEKDYIFEELKKDPSNNVEQIIILLNLSNNLSGMNLPYSQIIGKIISEESTIDTFKKTFLKQIHKYIRNLLNKGAIGSTSVFNLRKMKNTPFIKYSKKISALRKKEFEENPVYKRHNTFDIKEIKKTYYGWNIANILKWVKKDLLSLKEFSKFRDMAEKLNLEITLR